MRTDTEGFIPTTGFAEGLRRTHCTTQLRTLSFKQQTKPGAARHNWTSVAVIRPILAGSIAGVRLAMITFDRRFQTIFHIRAAS
jgi:hypothetical protein